MSSNTVKPARSQRVNTRPATEAHQHHAALRALDDPAKLDRAARIVRLALARRRLAPADLGIDDAAGAA